MRIGVAKDRAFHFAYPDNLEVLAKLGAELVYFSPLDDRKLPSDLNGLYIPGGYPELFAKELADNQSMRDSIRLFGESDRSVYGECGGLMYLGQAIRDENGKEHNMVGLAPIVTQKLERLRTLGYVEVEFFKDNLWGNADSRMRGHEFHYSKIISENLEACGWESIYRMHRLRRDTEEFEGFSKGNMLLSYVHLHWASLPGAAKHFIDQCRKAVIV